jgi:hypothetical protein
MCFKLFIKSGGKADIVRVLKINLLPIAVRDG